MAQKKIFITFGNKTFKKAKKVLTKQVKKLKVFDQVIAYGPEDFDDKFIDKHGEFIKNNRRGYGYFIWKPYIILKTLQTMDDNDILVYADSGCRIYPQYKDRLFEYFDMINESEYGMLNFNLRSDDLMYTKSDLAEYFGVLGNEDILSVPQVAGGIQILRKCEHSHMIMEKWMEVFDTDYHLIDDSPSKIPNHESFRDHRHDQSVISLLVKIHGSVKISDETYPPGTGIISADRKKK